MLEKIKEELVYLHLKLVEYKLVVWTGGNVSAAARALGVSRATLHRKLHRLGLAQPEH